MTKNTALTRNHPHRANVAPKLAEGEVVTLENAYTHTLARITSVTRVGARLEALLVTVTPLHEDTFTVSLDGATYEERTDITLKVQDDGLPYKSLGDASFSLEPELWHDGAPAVSTWELGLELVAGSE